MPAAPVITSVTFDKASYNPGDLITVTVTYAPGKSDRTATVTGTVTDEVTGMTGAVTGTAVFADAVTDPSAVTVTDSAGLTWTPGPATGTTATFTATAP